MSTKGPMGETAYTPEDAEAMTEHTPTPAEQLAELQRAWEADELSFAEWFARFESLEEALARWTS